MGWQHPAGMSLVEGFVVLLLLADAACACGHTGVYTPLHKSANRVARQVFASMYTVLHRSVWVCSVCCGRRPSIVLLLTVHQPCIYLA